MTEELQVLQEITSRLNQLDIPYMITGSMAANFYAQPRMTRDIDLVLVLKQCNVEKFVQSLNKDFYVDQEMIEGEIKRKGMFNLIHHKFMLKVDCILLKDNEYQAVEFSRRIKRTDGEFVFYVIAPEDLIISKLNWAKQGESEVQLRDIKNVLSCVEDLDLNYIDEWVGKLDLLQLYEQVKR